MACPAGYTVYDGRTGREVGQHKYVTDTQQMPWQLQRPGDHRQGKLTWFEVLKCLFAPCRGDPVILVTFSVLVCVVSIVLFTSVRMNLDPSYRPTPLINADRFVDFASPSMDVHS
eukprot:gb/GEZN01028414.1/.p1 GENE.gb/GEZN01028414.1/~~gb/GEZN01028414.1/.p1  ORF type:complete len:124 (-),score=11.88 gb/GEZN01028414.1/:112-456(-)